VHPDCLTLNLNILHKTHEYKTDSTTWKEWMKDMLKDFTSIHQTQEKRLHPTNNGRINSELNLGAGPSKKTNP
jgi:hypothetical protein